MYETFKAGMAAALLALMPLSGAAAADSVADFYKGKTLDFYIGYSVGGGYDIYARAVAAHLGKHIPGNPTVVPKNMTGAGSLKLANWLYRVAPKDGTAIGAIGRGTAFDPLFKLKGAQYDASKYLWLGSANDEVSVCVAWKGYGITKFDDLLHKELVVGGTGASADTDQFPKILNYVLHTKFRIITGYPGGNEVGLAMERGEVHGRCGWSWSSVKTTHMAWVKNHDIYLLVQLALHKHPDLPNVPLVMDLAKTPEEKTMLKLVFVRQSMGRPYLAPPGIPADRAAALRKAFMDTMHDPAFIADAEKAKLEINPVSGEDVQKLVAEAYAVKPETAARVAAALNAAAQGRK